MPIAPLFTWSETATTVEVKVDVAGASRSKADVFATDCLLKINCPPYLLILDLFGIIDESKTVVSLFFCACMETCA